MVEGELLLALTRLVVFEQLCGSIRRKLGQLHCWVLSQHIGAGLACLLARKLPLVPFGDRKGEPSPGSGLPAQVLAGCVAGYCLGSLQPRSCQLALGLLETEMQGEIRVYCQQIATLGTR